MIQFASRSSAVLYNFLISNRRDGMFLIPANVCPVVPLTLAKANVPFYFIDIDASHGMNKTLCWEKMEQLGQIAGVLYVSPYGKDMDNADFYGKIKEKYSNALIIEDNCLSKITINCFTPPYQSDIDLSLFSTGYSKYVDIGYGGWGILSDSLQYHLSTLPFNGDELTILQGEIKKCFASKTKFEYDAYNWLENTVIDDLVCYRQKVLSQVEIVSTHKKEINDIYNRNIPDILKFDMGYHEWRYMLLVKSHRDILIERIFDAGLFVGTNYPSVTKLFSNQVCPNAEKEELEVVNLFNDLRVDTCFAERLCKIINTWYKDYEKDFLSS